MGYIPPQGLQNLRKYAYKGVDKSLLSNYVLNPYWNWLVKLWPKWVAPNTVRLFTICAAYHANFSLDHPLWFRASIYQLLDAALL